MSDWIFMAQQEAADGLVASVVEEVGGFDPGLMAILAACGFLLCMAVILASSEIGRFKARPKTVGVVTSIVLGVAAAIISWRIGSAFFWIHGPVVAAFSSAAIWLGKKFRDRANREVGGNSNG